MPRLFAGWRLDPGLEYRGVVTIIDLDKVKAEGLSGALPLEYRSAEMFFTKVEDMIEDMT